MITVRMPDLGTVEGTVTLVRWLKREGDTVSLGEPLFEVETDKGVSEVESVAAGVLSALLVREGALVASGDPIGQIEGGVSGAVPLPAPAQPAAAPPAPGRHEVPAPRPAVLHQAPHRASPTPSLAALARKWDVDLSALDGSGSDGAITRQDILAARDARRAGPSAGNPSVGAPVAAPHASVQAIVAARMSQSHREKPAFHVTMRADMTRVLAARGKLRFDAFFVKACGKAVAEFPVFKRYVSAGTPGNHDGVSIALAIDVDGELFAPGIRQADGTSVAEISKEIDRLVERAKARALIAEESQGTCFLVSNLGMYGVESFDAVILPEHAAALAVGAALPTPVAREDGVRVAPLAALTLSVDHRLINGAEAARFLKRIVQLLEEGVE